MKYLTLVLILLVGLGNIALADDTISVANSGRTKGLYFAHGASWAGVGSDGNFGYFTSAGLWVSLGGGFYLVTPGQSTVQGGDKSSLGFNPFVVIEWGNFLISGGPGVSSYVQSDLALSYGQAEATITWLFKNPKWGKDVPNSSLPVPTSVAPMKAGVSLFGKYVPGTKEKTFGIVLTVLN